MAAGHGTTGDALMDELGVLRLLQASSCFVDSDGRKSACASVPCACAQSLLDEISKQLRAWQPIETAPKDGTPFTGWIQSYFRGKGGHAIVLWHGGDWWDEKGWKIEPACWQPLPTPPVNRPGEPAGESKA